MTHSKGYKRMKATQNKKKSFIQFQIRQKEALKGNIPNVQTFLEDNIRQVRWLYNNSNKCTKVIEEKKVQIIVQKLKKTIEEQQNHISLLKQEIHKLSK